MICRNHIAACPGPHPPLFTPASRRVTRKDPDTRAKFNLQIFPDGRHRINLHNRLSELRHSSAEYCNKKKRHQGRCSVQSVHLRFRTVRVSTKTVLTPKVKVNRVLAASGAARHARSIRYRRQLVMRTAGGSQHAAPPSNSGETNADDVQFSSDSCLSSRVFTIK